MKIEPGEDYSRLPGAIKRISTRLLEQGEINARKREEQAPRPTAHYIETIYDDLSCRADVIAGDGQGIQTKRVPLHALPATLRWALAQWYAGREGRDWAAAKEAGKQVALACVETRHA